MRINFSPKIFNVNQNTLLKDSNLALLKRDTVSFTSMKKSGFNGIDLLVINKFKAPIEKFNSKDDLDFWCENKIDEIMKKIIKEEKVTSEITGWIY